MTAEPSPSSSPPDRRTVRLALWAERYLLPLICFYFAWQEGQTLSVLVGHWPAAAGLDNPVFAACLQHVILFFIQLWVGVLLLIACRPTTTPQNLREILVPLAASYFFLVYNSLPWWPEALQRNLLPHAGSGPLNIAALILGLIGPAISIWGIVSLGRSFGILIAVREPVFLGPYEYVRHPIYAGYMCLWIGLILTQGSAAGILLVTTHCLLFIYRAHLEETRLAASSDAYRAYMERTGFILPRFRLRS